MKLDYADYLSLDNVTPVALSSTQRRISILLTALDLLSAKDFENAGKAENVLLAFSGDVSSEYQSQYVNHGSIIQANGLDASFGNPSPSYKMDYVQSTTRRGVYGSFFFYFNEPRKILSASYDYYAHDIGSTGQSIVRGIYFFDKDENALGQVQSTSNFARDVWATFSANMPLENVSVIRMQFRRLATNSVNEPDTMAWLDNLSVIMDYPQVDDIDALLADCASDLGVEP